MQTVTIAQALQIAVQYHQGGRLSEAEQVYQQILQQEPNNVDALHLLGLIRTNQNRAREAVDLIGRAVAAAPQVVEFHLSFATALTQAGKAAQAAGEYRTVLAARNDLPDAHNGLGG